jgi:anthraniloyl-CoA monooxygenase
MEQITAAFADAARRASGAGFDLLMVDIARGHLLAGFLSPLTNRRRDDFGRSLENRLKFPLGVFDAIRTSWPEERPLGAALVATDWVQGGWDVDDAVAAARILKEHGCDVIQPVPGQTVVHDVPAFGRFYQVPFSDRIRNEAGMATLVGGNLTTNDEVNTILAAGRADLCVLDPSYKQ